MHSSRRARGVAAQDLMLMALKTPDRIATAAMAAFQSFRRPSLDFESGAKVGAEFIRMAATRLPPATVGRYTRLTLEVLQDGRPRFVRALLRYFSRQIKPFFGRNGRRLPAHVRREFGRDLLKRR